MRMYAVYALFSALVAASSDLSATISLSKRAAEGVYCYDLGHGDFAGFQCTLSDNKIADR